MRTIAISGMAALAAVLGGAAVPATAMAQPTTGAHPAIAARPAAAASAIAAVRSALRTAPRAVGVGVETVNGEPLISCVATTDCLGVQGSSAITDAGAATPNRVGRWNGSSWKGVGLALPKGTKSDDLNAVSCQGAKSCLVVGDYYTSTSRNAASHPLALSYNGTSLKPTTLPLPKGTTEAALSSVSCATTRYCVAVGQAGGSTAAFGDLGSLNIVETWNGSTWALHTIATVIGKTAVQPIGVSCATTAFCVLAGESAEIISPSSPPPSPPPVLLYVASWNGKKLTTMKPAVVGSPAAVPVPTSVSCATASNCAITGSDLGEAANATFTAFTEIWNGKTWQLAKVTWPKGTKESFTIGVSCYGAHSCEAVGLDGASAANNAPEDAAAVAFNGTAGTLQSVPAPSKGRSTAFSGVSCLSSAACVAVGGTGTTTAKSPAVMTGVWNGKTWRLEPGF